MGGVIYSLNWIPLGAFVRILGEDDPKEQGSFASKGLAPRFIVLATGSGMNFLLAVAMFAIAFVTGWPTRRPCKSASAGCRTAPGPGGGAANRRDDCGRQRRAPDSLETVQQVTRANAGNTVPFLIDRRVSS